MLLATKLFVPRPPSRVIHRQRLFDRLEEATESALTLISAPPGFGKTALVSGWIRARPERLAATAWLSLGEDDDDPTRFWTYLIETLRKVEGGLGDSALQLLRAPQPPSSETVAAIVVNDLAAASESVVCVLDDYHFISAESIHRGLVLLVDHMPSNGHLIVITRADPPWPLARPRAGKRLLELRAADLRFTEDEAARFLREAGLDLSAGNVEALKNRTEGWIAGLQMAALSMQDRVDTGSFIRDFTGSHRFVLDYLAQEVLARQPEQTRMFLLQTSILERLHGDLCREVTGIEQSQEMLEGLERANLFTEPLDDERRWYRYHQLFADVLRAWLGDLGETAVTDLHRRASSWYEAHGLGEGAVHHALEARDFERATQLIGTAASASFIVGSQVVVVDWLARLPEEAIAASPLVALVRAWARFVTGDWEGVLPALEAATQAVESAAPQAEREALQAQLEGIRAWVAYQLGDLDRCVALASAALPRMPEEGLVPRRIVTLAQGYGLLLTGEVDAARSVGAEAVARSRAAGDPLTESLAIALTAQADLLDGELSRAAAGYGQAITIATIDGEPLPSVGIAQVQLAEVLRERDDLGRAVAILRAGIATCERALGLPEWVFEGHVTLARVLAAQGDTDAAREAAARADSLFADQIGPSGMEPIVGRALGYRARYWLATGDLDRAAAWLREQEVSAESRIDPRRHHLYVLLARTLLAGREPERAIETAERLLRAAGDSASPGLRVELAVVAAIARLSIGDEVAATELIAPALRVAEREGYVRLFVDEGRPMLDLLARVMPKVPEAGSYVRRLTRAIPTDGAVAAAALPNAQLNERELALLRMLAVGRSNREIAAELFLSVNTVKWHARSLYEKLGVNSRGLAVARARDLGLL